MEHRCAAIILMAGEGRRFGSEVPKQFHLLGDQEVYQHTLTVFLESGFFQQIILVCHPEWMDKVKVPKGVDVIAGGSCRQASSCLGLAACKPTTEFVMIHDAVRPFVSKEILRRNLEAVVQHRAVDTCIPSSDTVVHSSDGDYISSIPIRHEYLRGQTPQTFDFQLICDAHKKTRQQEATDDCFLVLEQGCPVAIVLGEDSNMKITTEFDLKIGARLQRVFNK